MTPHADHSLLDPGLLLLVPLAAAAALGGGAAALERRRGRPWPLHRTALLLGGLATAALCFTGPLAEWSHADPRGAMLTHLVLGMLAPLLLVLSAPSPWPCGRSTSRLPGGSRGCSGAARPVSSPTP
nr:cytochrome c oxidase assembly protein [Rathayibacter sp. AY1E3]